MPVATIILIAQFAMQFGVPAAQQLIALFSKTTITQADWDLLWKTCQTPFDQGLDPNVLKP
ncbi:MAG: hypothetical protein ABSA97_07420 [Verrucomicrobiia bacterium]